MGKLVDSSALLADAAALRECFAQDGYVFLRGLLPRDAVRAVRHALLSSLQQVGWVADGTDPMDGVAGPNLTPERADIDPAFFVGYERIQRAQPFHELAHHPALVGLVQSLLQDQVLVHPRKIARVGPPRDDFVVPAHQDYRLIQGALDTLTAWVPLGAVPDQVGGLRVLRGSQRLGLLPADPVPRAGGVQVDPGVADDHPDWLESDFEAGDVLVFHAITVHAAKPNRSEVLRLSGDFRYQRLRDPVVEGSLLPHHHPQVPAYEVLTDGWTSTTSVEHPHDVQIVADFDPLQESVPLPASTLVPMSAV